MRIIIVILLFCASAFGEVRLNLTPPAGSTFAPGQRFDVRFAANELRGKPRSYSVFVNGRNATREIFGAEDFQTFPLLDAGRNASNIGDEEWHECDDSI